MQSRLKAVCVSDSLCLSLCPSVCQSVSLTVCQSVSVCLCQSISVCLSVCVSQSLSVCLCQSVSLSVYVSVSLSVCLSVCQSLCLPVCLLAGLFCFLGRCSRRSCSIMASLSKYLFFSFPHKLPIPLEEFLYPIEPNHALLALYLRALATQTVR